MHEQSIVQLIASTCDQIHQLQKGNSFGNTPHIKAITQQKLLQCNTILNYLEDNFLPSGSGFDQASTIDRVSSGLKRVVIDTSFHHMDEYGFYDRWTYHSVHCIPDFSTYGFRLLIKGNNYKNIKDYIADAYHPILTLSIDSSTIQSIIKESTQESPSNTNITDTLSEVAHV